MKNALKFLTVYSATILTANAADTAWKQAIPPHTADAAKRCMQAQALKLNDIIAKDAKLKKFFEKNVKTRTVSVQSGGESTESFSDYDEEKKQFHVEIVYISNSDYKDMDKKEFPSQCSPIQPQSFQETVNDAVKNAEAISSASMNNDCVKKIVFSEEKNVIKSKDPIKLSYVYGTHTITNEAGEIQDFVADNGRDMFFNVSHKIIDDRAYDFNGANPRNFNSLLLGNDGSIFSLNGDSDKVRPSYDVHDNATFKGTTIIKHKGNVKRDGAYFIAATSAAGIYSSMSLVGDQVIATGYDDLKATSEGPRLTKPALYIMDSDLKLKKKILLPEKSRDDHGKWIEPYNVQQVSNDRFLVSKHETIMLFDGNGNLLKSLSFQPSLPLRPVVLRSSNASQIAFVTADKKLIYLDSDGMEKQKISLDSSVIMLKKSQNGNVILGMKNGAVKVFTSEGRILTSYILDKTRRLVDANFSTNGNLVVSAMAVAKEANERGGSYLYWIDSTGKLIDSSNRDGGPQSVYSLGNSIIVEQRQLSVEPGTTATYTEYTESKEKKNYEKLVPCTAIPRNGATDGSSAEDTSTNVQPAL